MNFVTNKVVTVTQKTVELQARISADAKNRASHFPPNLRLIMIVHVAVIPERRPYAVRKCFRQPPALGENKEYRIEVSERRKKRCHIAAGDEE
jgi:hypothetical protein